MRLFTDFHPSMMDNVWIDAVSFIVIASLVCDDFAK